MPNVIRNKSDIFAVGNDLIAEVKRNALVASLRRARINLHKSEEDTIQEMVIAFCFDSINPVHRHLGRTESLHAIEGRAAVIIFDDVGSVTHRIVIGSPGFHLPILYRLSASLWHTVIPLDPIVVLHEIAMGPFKGVSDTPEWAPVDSVSLCSLINSLREEGL